jgi:hypothetical protein
VSLTAAAKKPLTILNGLSYRNKPAKGIYKYRFATGAFIVFPHRLVPFYRPQLLYLSGIENREAAKNSGSWLSL